MSLKIDRAELEIVIKNDTSRKRMRELEDDMRNIRREMKKLDESSPEFKGKLAELKKAQAEYDTLIDKIGLAGLNMKELRKRQQELNAIISQLPGTSPLYDQYRKQLNQVNDRLKELKGTAGDTQNSLSKLADGFNKYFNLGVTFAASITGASMAFRSMAEEVAKVDDIYSDVMKTTGMTHDEVVALNEEFKKIDTRTSRDELNKLATEAGKIGLSGKKDIMDFVEAGNQIRVALGEDLGEDAITSIGKMVGVFQNSTKQLQGIGLKEQMLSVGSAINELGANSTASEPYLVQFAGRLGGISKQAKISMADILGYASALDQDMQQVEMSATAMQQFIMKLMGEPSKFAKLAGLNVKEFTKLLNEDTNAAIKQVLRALNEKGSFQALIPVFQEMGLDGARATGVLSSMAGSIDKIDEAQRIANQAMTDGVSITKEYGLKNDNLAARLDKVKKNFRETQLELGAKLNPALLTSTNYLTYLTKGLVLLIQHWGTVSKFLLIITGYTAAYNGKLLLNNLLLKEGIGLKAKELILKAKDAVVLQVLIVREAMHAAMIGKTTLATKAAAVAQVLWNNVIKANPLGALLAVITTVAAGIWLVTSRMREASQTEISAMNVKKKVAEQYDDQESKIRMLIDIINNEKIALNERKKALEELKGIVPGYHADLTNEGRLINNNKEAIKEYLIELEKQIYLEAIKEERTALIKQKRQQEKQKQISDNDLATYKSKANQMYGPMTGGAYIEGTLSVLEANASSAANALIETTAALKSLDEEYIKISNSTKKTTSGPKSGDEQLINGILMRFDGKKWVKVNQTATGGGNSTDKDPLREKLNVLEEYYKQWQLMNKQYLNDGTIDEEKYNEWMLQSKKDYLNQKYKLQKDAGVSTVDTEIEIADLVIQENELQSKKLLEIAKETGKKEVNLTKKHLKTIDEIRNEFGLRKIKIRYSEELKLLKEKLNAEKVAEKEKAKAIRDLKLKYAEEVSATVGNAAQQLSNIVNSIQDIETQKIENSYNKRIEIAREAGDETAALEEEKEEKIKEVKKKYADISFAITAAKIIANTAEAVMRMLAEGGIAGYIFAGIAAATGAVELGLANAQREAVKGYYSGGFTNPGNDTEEAGKVHKNEFVANAKAVRNPHVRKFLDVFNQAQMNGSIQMINTTQILERVRYESSPSYASGGYVQTNTAQNTQSNDYLLAVIAQNNSVMSKLNDQLEKGIEAFSVISGKSGSYEKTKEYERYINNASR